jgi:hypothetical protein
MQVAADQRLCQVAEIEGGPAINPCDPGVLKPYALSQESAKLTDAWCLPSRREGHVRIEAEDTFPSTANSPTNRRPGRKCRRTQSTTEYISELQCKTALVDIASNRIPSSSRMPIPSSRIHPKLPCQIHHTLRVIHPDYSSTEPNHQRTIPTPQMQNIFPATIPQELHELSPKSDTNQAFTACAGAFHSFAPPPLAVIARTYL